MDDLISRQDAINELVALTQFSVEDLICHTFGKKDNWIDGVSEALRILITLPSAEPEWNNHTVACLLAELYDDTCACNYNDNDEWLPQYCEVIDSCPNPCGVACWEQFLTHRNKVKK